MPTKQVHLKKKKYMPRMLFGIYKQKEPKARNIAAERLFSEFEAQGEEKGLS